MDRWKFGIDNDMLVKLVLMGKKTATSYLYDENDLPVIGEESIICFNDNSNACMVKTLDFKIMKFKDMTCEFAEMEGEGDLSLDYWKKVHYKYFKDLNNDFNEESLIIFEMFRVIKKFN